MENHNDVRKPDSVPNFVYESEQMRSDARDRRHWIGHIVSLCAIVAIVAGFLLYFYCYDYTSYDYQQDGQGVNIIGDRNGVDYGSAHEDQIADKEESFDNEG